MQQNTNKFLTFVVISLICIGSARANDEFLGNWKIEVATENPLTSKYELTIEKDGDGFPIPRMSCEMWKIVLKPFI